MVSVDITIPVLNEEKSLEKNIRILHNFLSSHYENSDAFCIFIADNGSTDKTKEIAERLASEHTWLRYIRLEERGVGRALKASWSTSKADIVGYMDLDLATDLRYLPPTIEALTTEGYDLVYATRLHKNSRVIGRTLKREITSRLFNLILKLYLGIHFSDGMCGFKFLRREVLPILLQNGAISDGWFFSTELLIVGEWHGLKLYEMPVTWTDDSDSRVRIVSLALSYLRAMRILKTKYPHTMRKS